MPARTSDRSLFRTLAVGGVMAWLLVFVAAPNLLVLGASFASRGETEFLALPVSLDSYSRLLSPLFAGIFADSFYLAAGTTLLCLLAGYPFAYILARLPKARRPVLLLLVIIPFWTNSLIRTYALVFILKTEGLLNDLLLGLGLASEPLSLLYTDAAVFVGLTYTLLPFMILPLYASIEKLDERLLEAARDLGASRPRVFWRITVPLTAPGIAAGCMLVFLPSFCLFYIPDILGGAKTLLVGNFIKNQFLSARDWPLGSAASMLLTGVMALLVALRLRLSPPAGEGERL
ncbi:MAG: spermidine/putrescine ABC transporter permease PotB [Thermodesulfobacteriota bacterium]